MSIQSESKRCLQCKNKPRCQMGCPVNTSIKEMIAMLKEGNLLDAGAMLFENNPLSVICGYVCAHEAQCQGHCVLGVKGEPIEISEIEKYISSYYLEHYHAHVQNAQGQKNNKKVAIIGGGPAGLTIAIKLAFLGYDITIFEAREHIGGVLYYGIPEFRLPKLIVEKYHKMLLKMGVKIRPNIVIGQGGIAIDQLFRDGYKSVFIGTGVWKPKALGIKGESLGNVHFAIHYLRNPDSFDLGQRVSVIGAGNVALDVARTALRNGALFADVFSRSKEESLTVSSHEYECAVMDGVKFNFEKTPLEITDKGVIFATITDGQLVDGSEQLYPSDSVIVSISQGPRNYIVSSTSGIEVGNTGLIITDEVGHTTRDGVFASGDVVTGARTVVEAVHISKKVAQQMHEYMSK